jgi:hypothetical protein
MAMKKHYGQNQDPLNPITTEIPGDLKMIKNSGIA